TTMEAAGARGLERQSDAALDRALGATATGQGICQLLMQALHRAQQRHRMADEADFAGRLAACDAQSDAPIERLRRRGELAEAEAAIVRQASVTTDRLNTALDPAAVRIARRQAP